MSGIHERLMKIYIVKVAVDFRIITIHSFGGKFYFEQIDELKKLTE